MADSESYSTPAPQPPPSAASTTGAAPVPAGAAPPTTTTPAPIHTPAAAPAPSADAGGNTTASSPTCGTASPVMEDMARKALAINVLKKDYGPERLEFHFVKSRLLGVIVEDLNDLTVVVDFKLEEDDHIGQAKELGVEKFDAIVTIDGVDARGWSFKSITNVIKEKTGPFRVEFARATPAAAAELAAAERAAKEAAEEAEAAASASQPKKS